MASSSFLVYPGVAAHLKKIVIERIILSVVALIMLSLTIKRGDKLTILLTVGLTIGILITWTGISIVITTGMIIYMLTALLISLINLKKNELPKFHRMTIVLTGIFAFGANLFSVMNWTFAGEMRLIMIIPVILFFTSLLNGMIRRQEIGQMTIMNTDFVFRLIG